MSSAYLGAVETFEVNGYFVAVEYDDLAESPRDFDTLGTIVGKHSRYDISDIQMDDDIETIPQLVDRYVEDGGIWYPAWMLEHGGVALNIAPSNEYYGFDTSLVGIIFANPSDIERYLGKFDADSVEKAYDILRNEVVEYGHYINGECYYYTVYLDEDFEIAADYPTSGFYDLQDAIYDATSVVKGWDENAYGKEESDE